MNLDIRVARATFVSDDKPDTEVRVLQEPGGGVTFTINFGNEDTAINSGLIGVGQELQLAESLQFVADTLGANIPGRLTPFVRGWINTAAEIHHRFHSNPSVPPTPRDFEDDPDFPGFNVMETAIARDFVTVMRIAHGQGLRIAQVIEAILAKGQTE